jgi:hypothetical protein
MWQSIRYKQAELVLGLVGNIVLPLLFYIGGGPTFFNANDILHFCGYSIGINLCLPIVLRTAVAPQRKLIGSLSALLLVAYFVLQHLYSSTIIYNDRSVFAQFILPIMHLSSGWLYVWLLIILLQEYHQALPPSQANQLWLRQSRLGFILLPALGMMLLLGTRMLSYVSSVAAVSAFAMVAISATIAWRNIGAYPKPNKAFLGIIVSIMAAFTIVNVLSNLLGMWQHPWASQASDLCYGYNAYCLASIPILYIWYTWYLHYVRKSA